MLGTTAQDIRSAASMLKDIMNENNLCVFSSKARVEKKKAVFDKVVVIK